MPGAQRPVELGHELADHLIDERRRIGRKRSGERRQYRLGGLEELIEIGLPDPHAPRPDSHGRQAALVDPLSGLRDHADRARAGCAVLGRVALGVRIIRTLRPMGRPRQLCGLHRRIRPLLSPRAQACTNPEQADRAATALLLLGECTSGELGAGRPVGAAGCTRLRE